MSENQTEPVDRVQKEDISKINIELIEIDCNQKCIDCKNTSTRSSLFANSILLLILLIINLFVKSLLINTLIGIWSGFVFYDLIKNLKLKKSKLQNYHDMSNKLSKIIADYGDLITPTIYIELTNFANTINNEINKLFR